MHSPLPAALRPAGALIVSRSESSVRTDLRALRALGVLSFLHSDDPDKALARLLEELESPDFTGAPGKKTGPGGIDIVICDESCNGVPASVLLYAMSRHPLLRTWPALVLASSRQSAESLREAGVYVLERPYAEQDMQRLLLQAMSPLRRVLRPEAFEDAAKSAGLALEKAAEKARVRPVRQEPMTTTDWFEKGMAHLKNKELAPAEEAFATVLERCDDHLGAALGLARIRHARNDSRGVQRCLLRAAAGCLRSGDKEQAASVAAMLPVGMRDKIFMHEAVSRMEQGEYRQAALSFLEAGGENPGIPLHRVIARACLLTPRPDEGMEKLCRALEGLGHSATAATLRKRLLAYRPYLAQPQPSWLDNYPLLKDAVSVASYAAWAWKQA